MSSRSAHGLDIVGAQRVQHFDDLDAALVELDAAARIVGDALDVAASARTLEARLSEQPNDGWTPTILVCAEPIGPEQLARLRMITGDGGRGTGAVVSSEDPSLWHASLDATELRLSPLGFLVTPALLDLPTASSARRAPHRPSSRRTRRRARQPSPDEETIGADITEPYTDPPFEIEVQVLGPVEILGGRSPLKRRLFIELAAYLAVHPNGASDERLKTVIWRDQAPTRRRSTPPSQPSGAGSETPATARRIFRTPSRTATHIGSDHS